MTNKLIHSISPERIQFLAETEMGKELNDVEINRVRAVFFESKEVQALVQKACAKAITYALDDSRDWQTIDFLYITDKHNVHV